MIFACKFMLCLVYVNQKLRKTTNECEFYYSFLESFLTFSHCLCVFIITYYYYYDEHLQFSFMGYSITSHTTQNNNKTTTKYFFSLTFKCYVT